MCTCPESSNHTSVDASAPTQQAPARPCSSSLPRFAGVDTTYPAPFIFQLTTSYSGDHLVKRIEASGAVHCSEQGAEDVVTQIVRPHAARIVENLPARTNECTSAYSRKSASSHQRMHLSVFAPGSPGSSQIPPNPRFNSAQTLSGPCREPLLQPLLQPAKSQSGRGDFAAHEAVSRAGRARTNFSSSGV